MESLSHDVFVGDFGDLIHLEVSGGLDVPDGHCHADDGVEVGVEVAAVVDLQFGSLDDLGAGVVFLGFNATLLGQLSVTLSPAGILAL